MTDRQLISVIIPVFNEETNLARISQELKAAIRPLTDRFDFEVLFMDNGSTDASYAAAQGLAEQNEGFRVIRLSRNFGYQANILSGYLDARGAAAIQLDADGEDDPALIPYMLELWKKGYDVVYGVRKQRSENPFLTLQRRFFYKLMNAISSLPIPVDAGDFRLLDRKVLESLKLFREANPYLRGIISYMGFRQIGFDYARRRRYSGTSKFSWWQYFTLAWDGITSFSRKPLVWVSWTGFSLSAMSFVGILYYFARYLVRGVEQPGFTTLVLLLLLVSGIQLLCLGVVGTYVGRIFDEVKRRPLALVEHRFPEVEKS